MAHHFGMTTMQLKWMLSQYGCVYQKGKYLMLKAKFAQMGVIIRRGQRIPYMRPKDTVLASFRWTYRGSQLIEHIMCKFGIAVETNTPS